MRRLKYTIGYLVGYISYLRDEGELGYIIKNIKLEDIKHIYNSSQRTYELKYDK